MVTKRIIGWMLATLCLFVVANAASYFLRSDGYGLPGVQDGVVRVGFPFLMMERGGFAHHEFVNLPAALGNLLIASVTAGFALGIGCLMKRASEPNA